MSAVSAHRPAGGRARSGPLVALAIVTAALMGSLSQLSHGVLGSQPELGTLDWPGGLLAACTTVPLVAWRRDARAVFALTAAAGVVLAASGHAIPLLLGPTAALYLFVASREEWPRRHTGLVVVLLVAYLGAAAGADGGFPGSELVHTALAWAVAWFAGERTRLRREHIAELRERAVRTERDAERERRLAAAEERARIARDLHDSAGHAVNVIALRAGTARLRRDPERSQVALEAIEELARRTVAEIDLIVGALRDRGSLAEHVDAPPGLASLDTLVARSVAAGLAVEVASEGQPRPLASAVDQAAYRILQEALTNAARHGRGPADVTLTFGKAALVLTVSNGAHSAGSPRASGGHGLIGMRERATLLGGDLHADRVDGAFHVRARLPYAGQRL